MNFLMKRFLLCPIPDDQKPMNQYIELKENNVFTWLIKQLRTKNFESFFLFLCFLLFQKLLKKFILIFCIYLFFFFFFLFFFFRLKEIYSLFLQSRILYEEASWFDIQCWDKPFFLIKNDSLLANQKIRPQLQWLSKKISLFCFFGICFFFFSTWISF